MLVPTADASDESGACFSILIIQKTHLQNPFPHCKRLKSFVAMAFPERRSLILNWAVIFATILFQCGIANGEYAYRDALMRLKASIVDPLGVLDDWVLSDNDPCYWTGVSCNEDHSVVLALDLSEKSLSGTLSPAIGKLKGIMNLTLDLNNFTGPFPAEITALSTLRVLNISHNNFSRMFPQNLSYMCNLEVLDAYNNNFSGPLPEQLSQISTLRHLHLGGSYFEGTIPSAYGNMIQLKYMALCGNSLTGLIPPELGNMTHLEELYLGYYNQFDGGIPPQFGNLFNLIRLDLSSCGLNGSIPAQLGNLIKLDSLFLQINSLSGPIPPELGYLINLKSLDLSNNKLTGRIPPELGYLENLELLMLFLNDLHGEVPGFLAELPKLQVLSLWSNGLSGKIPERLGSNGNLVEVDLSNNSLVGQIPPLLCKGGKLKVLVLLQNHLSGSIPASLGLCRDLNRVRLGDNQLSGPLPDGLLQLKNLDMLELIHNQLNGSIPSHIDAPILSFMDISSNHLQGPIPSDIGNLPHLQKLFLWNNFLSGPIPSEISNLSSLAHLDLRGNSLSGPIPDQLGKCSNMIYLDLSQNNLSGTIPPQLGSMPVLAFLNLSRNHLQGQIPNELNRLQSLTSADFSYNELSGPVPTDGQFEYFNISCFIGNSGLCGRGLQPCSGDVNNGIGVEIRRKPLSRIGSALLGSIFAFALCFLLVLVCFLWQRNENAHIFPWCGRSAAIPKPWRLTSFQKLDLDVENVLECLHEDNIIGQGGAGIVYRGQMPSGDVIAVKKLFKAGLGSRSGAHDDHGFSAEIRTLGKIRHRNIVKLLGFCSNDDHNLLLYEYMPNGSLGDLLHGKKKSLLDWNTRYKIALQAANGLCYLHHDCNPRIIHRDVKSNNILLDSEFEAHVADFGLAKPVLGTGENQSMSLVAGSCGYIAPEYACNLKVNEKADIYSFGVVLLELVTGKKPTDDEFKDGMPMVMWVSKSLEHERGILAVVDTCLTNPKLPLHEVSTVVGVALLCCCYAPSDRPTMRDVVQMLTDCRTKSKSNSFKDTNNKESLEVSKEIPLIAL